jgi:hypothetical protein
VLSLTGDPSLTWTASPLRWPAFHLLPFVALLPLAAPLFLSPSRRIDRRFAAAPTLTGVDA